MKHYFWKFVLCFLPCILAGWATANATIKFYEGESGGFKLGVDLVGGTILVYEIDLRKSQDTESKFDPVKDINVLAESLKRRIDPNDLYNITIRPAGGEGRIEIILPTGGVHRAQKADENWRKLLDSVKKEFLKGLPETEKDKVQVGRGKTLELADKVQEINAETLWTKNLFNTKQGWSRLQKSALQDWAVIDNDEDLRKKLMGIPVGHVAEFEKFIIDALAKTTSATNAKVMQMWLKKQAWDEMMALARQKWTYLQPATEDMERIGPDNVDRLTTFILAKGNVIAQSALALTKPLVGTHLERVFDDGPDAKEIHDFVVDTYGPPAYEIVEKITKFMTDTHQGKDLSVEEVQRIKDLITKIGSLEFRILANDKDDVDAIKDATKMLNDVAGNQELARELRDDAERGLPPPGPRQPDGKPKIYDITTARNAKSRVTYSWVELGPQQRRALNLDNAARGEPRRNAAWVQAANNRDKAIPLGEDPNNPEKHVFQGALFYSRKCEDRNLPADERHLKEVEYFVLTRDPEFDPLNPEVRTPKIDGSYLTRADSQPGPDLRPAVSFQFNNTGGELFGNVTRKNVIEGTGPEGTQRRRHLAIILDGLVMSAPTINSEIRTHGQISGNFTQKEVNSLVTTLRSGRLPATLKPQPVSESTIAATLGEDTIASGVQAILLAFLAVLAFMCVYYRFAGIVASIALMANLLLTVGFMVAVQATFTLSGLAGIVLTLGMAVDANVLIYERLREERERGASLLQAIRNGYDRALPTIIDTHLSSIFTAIVLYVVGNDNLKGFAVSMTVGLLISLFTSLFMTRLFFDYWQMKGWLTKLTMMRLFAKPDIDFMSIRYVMFAVTLGLAILGIGLFVGRLPNDLNIDFVGGTAYGGKLTKGVTITELRKLIDVTHQKQVLGDPKVVSPNDPQVKEIEGSDGRRFLLTYPLGDKETRTISFNNVPDGATPQEREKTVTVLAKQLLDPSVELLYNATDDPAIKAEIDKGESRIFTVRTTEKEPELVQAVLDQLLRDKETGAPLLKKAYAKADPLDNRETRIRFYDKPPTGAAPKTPTATASVSFVKSLLNRELRRSFGVTDPKLPLPFLFEIAGEGNTDPDGKYGEMKFSADSKLSEEDFPKVESALRETEREIAARPLPDRLEVFDSALALETRYRAMWAILASWAAILLYLWFRFGNWTFGLAAVICLIHDLFFTIGAIAACYFVHDTFIGTALFLDDFKLDLASVAALLTLVGYSVNDTIVVFDRIREVRGKNPDLTPKMINDSINQTLSRTILSSLTVWLVVFVLYLFGGPGVHLFAFVMVVGVIVGTYSSIYIASPLLLIFGEGKHEETVTSQGAKVPMPKPETAPA